MTALTEALRDLARRDAELAHKDERLEKAHREIGAQAYTIRDLSWRLERAQERIAELERAQEMEDA